MKNIFLVIAFITVSCFTACFNMGERVNGNGNIKSENRDVSSANKINVLGDMDVLIDAGPAALRIETDENILPFVITKTDDGWLEIRTRDNANINTTHGVKVYITTPDVKAVKITGSGNVTFNKKFSSSDDMSFKITGSGDINANVNTPKVDAEISGSGNLHIQGETKKVEIHIAGSGDYDGTDLKAEDADVSIAGSGDASLYADANLKASLTGSGTVKYKGNASVTQQITGSGSVSKIP